MIIASTQWIASLTGMTLIALSASPCYGQQSDSSGKDVNGVKPTTQTGQTNDIARLEADAQLAVRTFKQQDPTLETFFRTSAGYVVFPTVGEAAFIVGGAHGKGVVYQNGQPIGEATVTKGTVGAQVGGQVFSEVIFFQSQQSLQQFKQGNYEFSAGLSAVAANSGVGAATNYRNGVAVFTASRSGLMAKAAIGGQKFSFQPLAMGGAGYSGQGGTLSSGSPNALDRSSGSSH